MSTAWQVYLAGEIHSNWRDLIRAGIKQEQLPVTTTSPEPDHDTSDRCGEIITKEDDQFWYDHRSAKINSIRNQKYLAEADIVVVKFGEKYKQWNAAFEAGYAAALGKPLIVIHPPDFIHALKEIDGAAKATVTTEDQVVEVLRHITR